MNDLISVGEADSRLQSHNVASPLILCPLSKAAGRIAGEDILADRPLPPFDRVMMDGYALRFESVEKGQAELEVVAQALAGEPASTLPDGVGNAVEVMTGAPLPIGADTVVPYEVTQRDGSRCSLLDLADIERGQYIHPLGSDFPNQSILVEADKVLGPVEMGIAASCGYSEILVRAHPRIAVASTGDELVPIGDTPLVHQIRASNATAIESALGLSGFNVGSIVHWDDDAEMGATQLRETLNVCEILIIAGAVSKGVRDWVPGALDTLAKPVFHGVKQRPGKPMGFWVTDDDKAIFALPGNPVSALVGAHRYVIPYLEAREQRRSGGCRTVTLAEGVSFEPPLTWFLPVVLQSDGSALPLPVRNSGDYARLHGSDGFIELPAEDSAWTPGTEAAFYPWSV
ncbi:MAG: molybdopterin molybdotransferase MoeA [Verrucomicrobiota bacterium]